MSDDETRADQLQAEYGRQLFEMGDQMRRIFRAAGLADDANPEDAIERIERLEKLACEARRAVDAKDVTEMLTIVDGEMRDALVRLDERKDRP